MGNKPSTTPLKTFRVTARGQRFQLTESQVMKFKTLYETLCLLPGDHTEVVTLDRSPACFAVMLRFVDTYKLPLSYVIDQEFIDDARSLGLYMPLMPLFTEAAMYLSWSSVTDLWFYIDKKEMAWERVAYTAVSKIQRFSLMQHCNKCSMCLGPVTRIIGVVDSALDLFQGLRDAVLKAETDHLSVCPAKQHQDRKKAALTAVPPWVVGPS